MILRFSSDAGLIAKFDKILADMRAASHAQPRTSATKAKAKALGVQLKEITTEMTRRSDIGLVNIAISDAVVGEIDAVVGEIDAVVSGVSGVFSGLINKLYFGLALVGFVLYQWKK